MDYEIYQKGDAPKRIVFMLHGYGSNGRDLMTLAPEMSEGIDDIIFISPNACQPFEGGQWGCFQWYTLINRTEEGMFEACCEASNIVIAFIISLVQQYNIDWSNVFVLGFSQGCALALHLSYRLPHKIGGVIGICGRLNSPEHLQKELLSKPETLLIHGQEDNVVPPYEMERAAGALRQQDVKVTTHLRPKLAHGIDAETVVLVNDFLA